MAAGHAHRLRAVDLSGAALMWHLDMFDAQILAQNVINGADSFPLLAVPFFMLAGEIMNVGGLSPAHRQPGAHVGGPPARRPGLCHHPGRGDDGGALRFGRGRYRGPGGVAAADDGGALATTRRSAGGPDRVSAGIIAPVIPPSDRLRHLRRGRQPVHRQVVHRRYRARCADGRGHRPSPGTSWPSNENVNATAQSQPRPNAGGCAEVVHLGLVPAGHRAGGLEDGRVHAHRSRRGGRRCTRCSWPPWSTAR